MAAAAMGVLFLFHLPCVIASAGSSTPSPETGPVQCIAGSFHNCTLNNAYGSYNDRQPCRAAKAVYPRTEAELVAAVAAAVKEKRKVKATTAHSHSFPKLACPGGGGTGTIISTAHLNRVLSIDAEKRQMTVETGMLLMDLIDGAAAAGLALPNSPYFYGVTVGGLLATGAHGSSLMGKGGAVHEYVVKVRIVTPAKSRRRLAVVRELCAGDPDLNAVKVSLGVLGVISQVTLQLEPLFKRSVTVLRNDTDADLADLVATWGHRHEFGDIYWLPGQGKVMLGKIDRVNLSTPGDGLNVGFFRLRPTSDIIRERSQEEQLQEEGSDEAFCRATSMLPTAFQQRGFGFTNDGNSFTGYPVVGYQHKMQASGSCLDGPEEGLVASCPWNPRVNGSFFHNAGISVTLSKATEFVRDVMRLRDRNREAFCSLDLRMGFVFRYIKGSTAFLGKPEDSVEFDIIYYRSREQGKPVRHADVFDEVEQMALYKYGGLPHWGKNRNYAFNDTVGRFPKLQNFLEVKARFDPDGVFSSRWSDQVLGISGSPVIPGPGCAVEGLCTCTQDSDCAPGYTCSTGRVYSDAKLCTVPLPQ